MPPFTELLSSSIRVSAAMFKGIFYLAGLAVALVLYPDLAESQCTTRYREDHDEADLWAVCLRNQDVVEQLMKELSELKEKVARLEKSKYSVS